MGDAYRLDELRFPQEYSVTSAADATFHVCSDFIVPVNMVRTILYAHYYPSASESRSVYFGVLSAGGSLFNFRGPITYNSAGGQLAVLEQGNEIRLLPGQSLRFGRDVATAGSTMLFRCIYVDHFIPYQKFVEPLTKQMRRSPYLSNPVASGGGGGGAGGGGGSAEGGEGEGGGGFGEPVL